MPERKDNAESSSFEAEKLQHDIELRDTRAEPTTDKGEMLTSNSEMQIKEAILESWPLLSLESRASVLAELAGETHLSQASFKDTSAEWALSFYRRLARNRVPGSEAAPEMRLRWNLSPGGEEVGWVSVVSDPETGQLELVVVEVKDRKLQGDGTYSYGLIRFVSNARVVQYLESRTREATRIAEGRGIEEAIIDKKYPPNWLSDEERQHLISYGELISNQAEDEL